MKSINLIYLPSYEGRVSTGNVEPDRHSMLDCTVSEGVSLPVRKEKTNINLNTQICRKRGAERKRIRRNEERKESQIERKEEDYLSEYKELKNVNHTYPKIYLQFLSCL